MSEKSELDQLPLSTMSIDAEKRNFFSEQPYNKLFFKDFWRRFDKNGFSIYQSEYKYPEENQVLFMTSNLLHGFLRNCDAVRKYAFGVVNVLGKDEDVPPFYICGMWIFRGLDVPKEMMIENDQAEHHVWRKMDPDLDRAEIENYFFGSSIPLQHEDLVILERRFCK